MKILEMRRYFSRARYPEDEEARPIPWAGWYPNFKYEAGRPIKQMYRPNPLLQWAVDERHYRVTGRHYEHDKFFRNR